MTISREKISFLYKKLRTFIDSLEKKFALGAKKQENSQITNTEMEIDDRMEIDAERLPQTYSRCAEGRRDPNKIEVFSDN